MHRLFRLNNLVITATSLLILMTATGHATDTIHYDQINLSISAEDTVNNDILVARLAAINESKSIQRAAEGVNTTFEWALRQIKKVNGVQAQTLRYHTTPIYKNKKISAWRVRQAVQLESSDTVRLANLIGLLQEKMALNSMQYRVSLPVKQQAEEQLTNQALALFKKRAELVTKALGAKNYRIVQLNIGSSRQQPVYPMAMRAESFSSAKAVAPSFKAGSQTVKVAVDGTIQLSR